MGQYGFVLYQAETMKQLMPVVSLFAGVALAVAFIESSREPNRLRKAVVVILSWAAVLLICAIAATAAFVTKVAPVKIRVDSGMTPKTDDVIPSMLGEHHLSLIHAIGTTCSWSGLWLVFLAMAISGFAHGRGEGLMVAAAVLMGTVLIFVCFRLL